MLWSSFEALFGPIGFVLIGGGAILSGAGAASIIGFASIGLVVAVELDSFPFWHPERMSPEKIQKKIKNFFIIYDIKR